MYEGSALVATKQDGIAEVELCGPGKGNAMGPEFWRELPELFGTLDADPDVRAVVLRGRGDHFSYGLDLKAMMGELGPYLDGAQLAGRRVELRELVVRLQQAVTSVERCRKPVIAAIHGWCIGGGVDLATACDVRVCSADAKLSVREVQVAMVADLGSLQRLPRIVGQGHARELAMTAKDVDAHEAARIGLVNAVHDSPEALLEGARARAREMASHSPLAVQGTKQVLNYSADRSVEDGLTYVATWNAAFLQSHDLSEALAAFMERRNPKFTGE